MAKQDKSDSDQVEIIHSTTRIKSESMEWEDLSAEEKQLIKDIDPKADNDNRETP